MDSVSNHSTGVALGQLNTEEDCDLDVVFSNYGQENRICFGDGAGGFDSCADIDSETDNSTGVELMYLNDDLHLDVVFSNDDAIVRGIKPGVQHANDYVRLS